MLQIKTTLIRSLTIFLLSFHISMDLFFCGASCGVQARVKDDRWCNVDISVGKCLQSLLRIWYDKVKRYRYWSVTTIDANRARMRQYDSYTQRWFFYFFLHFSLLIDTDLYIKKKHTHTHTHDAILSVNSFTRHQGLYHFVSKRNSETASDNEIIVTVVNWLSVRLDARRCKLMRRHNW